MISPNVAMNALLLLNDDLLTAIKTGSAARLYSPRLSPEWRPTMGPAVSQSVRGGPEPSLYTPIVKPSFQVTTWAATPKLARTVHGIVYDILHGAPPQLVTTIDGVVKIMWGKAESFPQDVVDPETGWFTVTSFFELGIAAELQEEV